MTGWRWRWTPCWRTPSRTEADDLIELSVRTEGDQAVLTVTDSGCGIPEEDLDRIFGRFARATPYRSRESGGFGLGLPLVAAIVEAHNGSVRVTSAVGGGSTFELVIPTTAERAEEAEESTVRSGKSSLSRTYAGLSRTYPLEPRKCGPPWYGPQTRHRVPQTGGNPCRQPAGLPSPEPSRLAPDAAATTADPDPACVAAAGDPLTGADRAGAGATADLAGIAELGTADGCAVLPVGAADEAAGGATVAAPRAPSELTAWPLWPKTATSTPAAATASSTTAPAIMPVRKLISSSQALMAARRPECDPNAPSPLTYSDDTD